MAKWGDTGKVEGRVASSFMEYFNDLFTPLLRAWAYAFRAAALKRVPRHIIWSDCALLPASGLRVVTLAIPPRLGGSPGAAWRT